MTLLLLAQLRFLARAPWSALTAVLGVALAVASVVAVHQIGAAVGRSLDAARPPHLAGLSHLLTRPSITAADYFRLRRAWREAAWPEVAALVPIVEGYRRIDGRRVLVLGADWLAYGGAPLAAGDPGAAAGLGAARLLDGAAVLADRALGVAAGRTLAVDGAVLEVAAVVDGGLGPALFADIAVAQRLLDRLPEALDFIGVAAADPWAGWRRMLDAAMPGISAGLPEPTLPAHPELREFGARVVASELPAAAFARAILFNLGALGLLALLVAWFLVHQVALIWVERQRPVFDRLHALGVPHASLAVGFVGSFALLGLFATAAGTGLGWGLAHVLIRISAPDVAGGVLPGRPDAVVLVKALVSGMGVCIAGGLLAFRRSSRAAAVGGNLRPGWRAAVMAGAGLVLVFGVTQDSAGLFGGFGAILALSLIMILAMRPLLEWLRRVLGRTAAAPGRAQRGRAPPGTLRVLARLGVREAVWRPAVVSVALAALVLAIATSMGVGLMVESLRADFARMMSLRLSGDLYLEGPAWDVTEAARWLESARGEPRISRYGEAKVRVGRADGAGADRPARLGYGVFDRAESARYGHARSLGPHDAIVNERLARDLGVDAGATILVDGVRLAVVHVYPGFGDPDPRLMIDAAALPVLGLEPDFDRLSVRMGGSQDGSDTTALSAAALAGSLAERFPGSRSPAAKQSASVRSRCSTAPSP